MAAEMPLSLYYEWLAYAQFFNPLAFSHKYRNERLEWAIGANTAQLTNVLTALPWLRTQRTEPNQYMPNPVQSGGKKKAQTPKEIYEVFKTALTLGGMLKE